MRDGSDTFKIFILRLWFSPELDGPDLRKIHRISARQVATGIPRYFKGPNLGAWRSFSNNDENRSLRLYAYLAYLLQDFQK